MLCSTKCKSFMRRKTYKNTNTSYFDCSDCKKRKNKQIWSSYNIKNSDFVLTLYSLQLCLRITFLSRLQLLTSPTQSNYPILSVQEISTYYVVEGEEYGTTPVIDASRPSSKKTLMNTQRQGRRWRKAQSLHQWSTRWEKMESCSLERTHRHKGGMTLASFLLEKRQVMPFETTSTRRTALLEKGIKWKQLGRWTWITMTRK